MLQTTHLDIGYGTHIVQRDLNLSAKAGDFICLTGTNGTGKSTLLRTLAGLQKLLEGHITIQGKEVSKLTNTERATLMSLVLTDPIAVENLTLHDLVAMGRFPYTNWAGKLSENDEYIVKQSLEQVNLINKANCYICEVSDGEKQRCVIARALAQDTPLVLLDEPTAHLDLPNRIDIMLLLQRLSVKTHKTFLLSTHELDLALQMADKIWLMGSDGVRVGIPEDLMLSGKFQEAFGSDKFRFDKTDGHCKINHSMGTLKVAVIGEKPAAIWLERALSRCGIHTVSATDITIEAHHDHFIIDGCKANSIEETLRLLAKI